MRRGILPACKYNTHAVDGGLGAHVHTYNWHHIIGTPAHNTHNMRSLCAATMAEGKEHLSIVICGHVDSGKSTTTGRLLFELGGEPCRRQLPPAAFNLWQLQAAKGTGGQLKKPLAVVAVMLLPLCDE